MHSESLCIVNEKQYKCNFRNEDEFPLEIKCLTPRVIYETDAIILNTYRKCHIELSDTPFKERCNNLKQNISNRHYGVEKPSKYIWRLH